MTRRLRSTDNSDTSVRLQLIPATYAGRAHHILTPLLSGLYSPVPRDTQFGNARPPISKRELPYLTLPLNHQQPKIYIPPQPYQMPSHHPYPPQDLTGIPTPSTHPTGTIAAATSPTPLSVANILYCAAAFLVSSTSTLTPISLTILLVSGLSGLISGPSARINKSIPPTTQSQPQPPTNTGEKSNSPALGQTTPNTPNTPRVNSHCPLAFTNLIPFPPPATQGLHLTTSPPTINTPSPPSTLNPFWNANPSSRHAVIDDAGTGVLPRTSMASRSAGGGVSGGVSALWAGRRRGV